jgi:predicted DNA-binding transcriptional regulator AlpA
MKLNKLINKQELADLLRTTVQTITNQISQGKEGKNLPPSIKLGSKYMWHPATVEQWLIEKEHERKVLLSESLSFDKPKVKINRV